jgi:hypothetical protein
MKKYQRRTTWLREESCATDRRATVFWQYQVSLFGGTDSWEGKMCRSFRPGVVDCCAPVGRRLILRFLQVIL